MQRGKNESKSKNSDSESSEVSQDAVDAANKMAELLLSEEKTSDTKSGGGNSKSKGKNKSTGGGGKKKVNKNTDHNLIIDTNIYQKL
jgi:hypothetical protein